MADKVWGIVPRNRWHHVRTFAYVQEQEKERARVRTYAIAEHKTLLIRGGTITRSLRSEDENARRARLYQGYKLLLDFWELGEWPVHDDDAKASLMLLAHKKNGDRYILFRFLTFNGVAPGEAQQAIAAADFRNGRFVYDPKSQWPKYVDHFKQMRWQLENYDLHKGTEFNMWTRKPEAIWLKPEEIE